MTLAGSPSAALMGKSDLRSNLFSKLFRVSISAPMADDADAQPDAAAQWAQWSQMVQQQQQQQAGGGATAEGAQQTAQQQQMAYMYQQQMAMAQMMVRARGRVVWRRWSRAHGEGSVGDVSRCVLCAVHREVCAGGHHAFPVVGLQWAQRNTELELELLAASPCSSITRANDL